MSAVLMSHTNGSKSHGSALSWKRQTVQQFFSAFNWEDHPPEVQALKRTSALGEGQPCSLKLSVSQFFSAYNWEDSTIAAMPVAAEPETAAPAIDAFTLEDFSDLF